MTFKMEQLNKVITSVHFINVSFNLIILLALIIYPFCNIVTNFCLVLPQLAFAVSNLVNLELNKQTKWLMSKGTNSGTISSYDGWSTVFQFFLCYFSLV